MCALAFTVAVSAPAAVGAAPVAGGPIIPLRGPSGHVLRNSQNQPTSSNWSGYAVARYETGNSYTSASGTWVVPSVSVPTGESYGYSASWVGIGGSCLNADCSLVDDTLIQLGTSQDATSSGADYYAWYEMLPRPEARIHKPVSPGDHIVASLEDAAAPHGPPSGKGHGKGHGQTWTLTIVDTSSAHASWTWSHTVSYDSSLASAEWIEEAPSSMTLGVLPLADFGTVTFDPGTVNGGASPDLTQGDGIVMDNPNGQTATVSKPDSDADGFNDCFGPTSCEPPSS